MSSVGERARYTAFFGSLDEETLPMKTGKRKKALVVILAASSLLFVGLAGIESVTKDFFHYAKFFAAAFIASRFIATSALAIIAVTMLLASIPGFPPFVPIGATASKSLSLNAPTTTNIEYSKATLTSYFLSVYLFSLFIIFMKSLFVRH